MACQSCLQRNIFLGFTAGMGVLSSVVLTYAEPETTNVESVAVELDVDVGVRGCPTLLQFAAWVDELVGRPFVRQDAGRRVALDVSRAGAALHARLFWATPPSELDAQPTLFREFRQAVSCEELTRTAALTVSLLAAPNTAGAAASLPPGSPGGGQSLAPELPIAPVAGTAPMPAAVSSTGPLAATLTPGSTSAAPTAQPLAQPASLPVVAGDSSPAAATVGQPAAAQPELDTRPQLGVAAAVGLGLNPGASVGVRAWAGLGLGAWAVRAEGEYLAGVSHVVGAGQSTARVNGSTWLAALSGCRGFADAVTVCGQVGHLWLRASGEGFDVDRSTWVRSLWLGGEIGYARPITSGVWLGPKLNVVAPLRPVRLEVVGVAQPVWDMFPVAVQLSLGLDWL